MNTKVFHYSTLESTNSEAYRLIKSEEKAEGIVVIADFQAAGRGQGDHSWHSNKQDNLLMSLVFSPAFLSVSQQFYLSKAVSLAMTDFLSGIGLEAKIKWPNDILLEGKKVAGILIENSLMGNTINHSIVGIGLNVNQTDFPVFPWEASSIILEVSRKLELAWVREELVQSIYRRYKILKRGEFEKLEDEYHQLMYRKGEMSEFVSSNGSFLAKMIGVNELGELLLEQDGKLKEYGFHEVRMAVPSKK